MNETNIINKASICSGSKSIRDERRSTCYTGQILIDLARKKIQIHVLHRLNSNGLSKEDTKSHVK